MNEVVLELTKKSERHFDKVRKLRKMITNLEVSRDAEEIGSPEYLEVLDEIHKLELQAERNLGQARAYEKAIKMIS